MKYITKEPINKGWSRDKKYCVTDENGKQYLLRVSDIAEYASKQAEFNMMEQVANLGVPMCRPIEFGICEDGVVPMEFWKLLALYIASNTLSSLYWAIPFGEDEIATMRNQAKEVLSWYDNMRSPIPSWYCKRY